MNLTDEERKTIKKFFKQVEFNDKDFVLYVFCGFVMVHYPDFPVFDLKDLEELDNLHDALVDVFHLVEPYKPYGFDGVHLYIV